MLAAISRFLRWRRQFHLSGAAVVIVDMQRDFVSGINPETRDALLGEQLQVIQIAAERGLPIVQVEYSPTINGPTVPEIQAALDAAREQTAVHLFVKHADDAFSQYRCGGNLASFEQLLTSLGARKLVIMGVNADVCVLRTAKSARRHRYELVTSKQAIAQPRRRGTPKAYRWFSRKCTLVPSLVPLLRGGADG